MTASDKRLLKIIQQEQVTHYPVRLDSLLLFDAGHTERNPDLTKVLINALVDIKAQPGWLVDRDRARWTH